MLFFLQLQAAFARHMLYLEEHREVGDGREKALQLAELHQQYVKIAMVCYRVVLEFFFCSIFFCSNPAVFFLLKSKNLDQNKIFSISKYLQRINMKIPINISSKFSSFERIKDPNSNN